MGLTHKTITVDEDVWNFLQRLNLNLSGEIRAYLANLKVSKTQDVDGISIQIQRMELEKKMEILSKTQSEIKNIQLIIEKFEENQNKSKEQELLKEKERIEKQNKCVNCGNILIDKRVELKSGVFVCKACYHSADLKKYLK